MHIRSRWVSLILSCFLASSALAAKPKIMSVQLRTDMLRATPEFMTKSVGTVKYADRVTVLETKGAWMKVTSPDNKTGWVHSSALSKKEIPVADGESEATTGVSSGEMANAGKGFSPEAEKGWKEKNPKISFVAVDKMEKAKVAPKDVETFLKQGLVEGTKGGAK